MPDIDEMRNAGFFVHERAFTSFEVAQLRAAAERSVRRAADLAATGCTYHLDGHRFVDAAGLTIQFEHTPDSETIRVIEPVDALDPTWNVLIDDSRLVEPMRALIGSEHIALWTAKLNLKSAREGSGFGWHQDSPYWIHDAPHVDLLPNVMLTLDDADEDNGCLRIIRGSHTRGCLPGTADGSQLGGFFTDPNLIDLARQVPIVAPAGSLVFFSPHAIHGSQPNASDRPRRAIVLTYQPGDHRTLKSRVIRNVACSATAP
jgi:hypothetical protein